LSITVHIHTIEVWLKTTIPFDSARELPPSAGFPSLSGGVAPLAPPLGAFGTPVRAPAAPIWATAAFGGGERKLKFLEHRGRPGRVVSLAYAASGTPFRGRLRRPKWF